MIALLPHCAGANFLWGRVYFYKKLVVAECVSNLVAVLMTPTEKSAYASQNSDSQVGHYALEAAPKQLELSINLAERALDAALVALRAA